MYNEKINTSGEVYAAVESNSGLLFTFIRKQKHVVSLEYIVDAIYDV